MMLDVVADHAPQETVPAGAVSTIRKQDGGGPRTTGHRGHAFFENLHAAGGEHTVDGAFHDLTAGFARDHQSSPNLAQGDGIGNLNYAIKYTKTSI